MRDLLTLGYRRLYFLTWVGFFLASALVIGWTAVSILQERSIATEPAVQTSSSLTRSMTEQLTNVFLAGEASLGKLHKQDLAKKKLTVQDLAAFKPRIRGIQFLFVSDSTGRVLISTDPQAEKDLRLLVPEESPRLPLQIGNIDLRRGPAGAFIPVFQPRLDSSGHRNGYLGFAVDVPYFIEFFKEIQLWGRNGLVVLTESGPMILRFPFLIDAVGQNFKGHSHIWEKADKEKVGWFYEASPYDGVEKMLFFRKVDRYGLIVMVNRARSDIEASWAFARRVKVTVAAAAVFAFFILCLLLWRQLQTLESDEKSRRLYEKHSRQIQKMEAIGRFAGGIAHDFNNILTILFGHMDRLNVLLPKNHETQEAQKKLLQSALKTRDLVRQILAFSRKNEIEKKEISLSPFAEDLRVLLMAALPANVDFKSKVMPGMHVHVDATSLTQVLMNLASNAVESMSEHGGVLELSMDEMSRSGKRWVRITLRDSGSGISSESLKKVFDPFYTTKGDEHAGMGLTTAKAAVEANSGSLSIKSHEGVGTVVEILFPLWIKTVVVPPTGQPQGPSEILFVDDEEAVVELVRDTFESHGIRCHCTSDPITALEEFQKSPDRFGLLVTDINMAPIDGFELTRRIHALRARLPVLFTTAHPEFQTKAEQHEAVREGYGRLLRKPYQFQELVVCLREGFPEFFRPLSDSEPPQL